jgi:hypothetical protein
MDEMKDMEDTQYKAHEKAEEEGRELDVLKYDAKVKKGYVPEGHETVEAYLKYVRETHASDLEADQDNRNEALDDNKFAVGEQWDPVVLEQRENLPTLVINSIPQFTAQVVGDWRENRRSVKVLASEDGDVEVASVRGDLIRSIEQRSRAQRVYNDAFESTITCGDGAFRVSVEYAHDDVFDQDIYLRPIEDALSVVWDRMSVDPTGRDARHCFVDDEIPKDEFEDRWPEHDPSTLSTKVLSTLTSDGWYDRNSMKVTEHWRIIERDRLLGMFENGKVIAIDKDNMEQVLEANGPPVRTRLAPCRYAQMHLVTGFAILGGPYEYKLTRLPIIRMVGRTKNVEGRRVRYGLVRFMKDPVRLRNFWRSIAAEQLGYAPKAQWMVTESAVEGKEDILRSAHLSRDPLMIFNDEAVFGGNVQRLEPPTPQGALLNEANVNTQDMKDVTGIHDASLGIRSNEVSGKAINARQREGDVASMTYFDNGDEAILEGGDVINQLISQIYDSTRIVRILGEDETQKFIKINDENDPGAYDMASGKYDVALASGTSYSTRRVEAAEAMMNAVQVWPQLLEVAGDLVAKAQDWPGSEDLSERLMKTIPDALLNEEELKAKGEAMPQEAQQQMMELQQAIQALSEENKSLKEDKSIDYLKIQVDAYNGETQRIRALSDNEVDNQEINLKGIKDILGASIDIHKIQQEAAKTNESVPSPRTEDTQPSSSPPL